MFEVASKPERPARRVGKVVRCMAVVCLMIGGFTTVLLAQKADKSEHTARKLVYKVDPDYPWDLKRAHIGGTVRMDIVVSPRGTVDTVSVLGGNPILTESALRAIKRWKYAPADSESILRVNVEFDPNR